MAAALPRKRVSFDSKAVVINEVSNPNKSPVEKEEIEMAAFMDEEESDSNPDADVNSPSKLNWNKNVNVSEGKTKINNLKRRQETPKTKTSGDIAFEKRRKFLQAKIKEYNKKVLKRGVVFLYRIPPYFNHFECRVRLAEYAKILRIYFEPEAKFLAEKRKKRKIRRRSQANFVRGWVEFEDKKEAKRIVKMLDGVRMSDRKGDKYYHDDWHMKYLKGFKWRHLKEKFQAHLAEQNQKMQQEMIQIRKEESFFKKQIKRAKRVKKLNSKRLGDEDEWTSKKRLARKFTQKKNIVHHVDLESAKALLLKN